MAGTDEVSDPNAASSDAVDAGGYIPEAPMHTSTQDLIDFQRKQRLEVLRHTIKQVDRNGAPRYRSATDYFDVFTAEPWAAVQPTSPPRPRPQIAQIRTPSPRPVSDHLPRPFLVHTPPLNAARLRSSPRTPHTHHRIDTKRVHDVLDKIRGADRIAEVRRGLGPPASNVAPASVPPQAPPPAPVAAPVAAQVSTTTSAETLDPSPVFHELPPSTPQSITKTVNDSRTIYSSPYLRTPQNKQMGIVSAPATLRRPKRRLSEASEPPPKRNAPETPWHLDDSPSLVYGAPVTPPQWTRIQWQYLSVLANLIPELDQGSLEDVKTFIDTSLPQWLVKEFHPFREELPSRLMALVKWNRTAKPGASDNLALTREVWDQVRGLMTKLLPSSND